MARSPRNHKDIKLDDREVISVDLLLHQAALPETEYPIGSCNGLFLPEAAES
jgi:hypothetical protein